MTDFTSSNAGKHINLTQTLNSKAAKVNPGFAFVQLLNNAEMCRHVTQVIWSKSQESSK